MRRREEAIAHASRRAELLSVILIAHIQVSLTVKSFKFPQECFARPPRIRWSPTAMKSTCLPVMLAPSTCTAHSIALPRYANPRSFPIVPLRVG